MQADIMSVRDVLQGQKENEGAREVLPSSCVGIPTITHLRGV